MPAPASQEAPHATGLRPALRAIRAGHPALTAFPKAQLRWALQERRLRVAYQPIVRLRDDHIVGQEALARLIAQDGTVLPAESFIGVAADIAFEPHIDREISAQVMAAAHAEPEPFTAERGKRFINCSSAFLTDPASVRRLADHHQRWRAARMQAGDEETPWVLEITERNLDLSPTRLRESVAPLLDLGFQLALDDFGSKCSAFPHLLAMPIRYLKIDQTLVQAAVTDARAELALRRVVDLAQGLGSIPIAKGIETAATRDRAQAAGVPWGQGYLWAAPTSEFDIEDVAH
ncbi:uncharacterized protein E1O_06000 [Burkholderiales bacterium GJ-E10]|nr:uncharacterized protein E1O_06000 [Burkholderiales bacterium GJ-E10]